MQRFCSPLRLVALLAFGVCLAGYSSGPASVTGNGHTGAPSANGGTEGLCGNCHNGGTSFGEPVLNIVIAETPGGTNVTEYTPGQDYFVTVNVSANADPFGYGFQSVFLSDPGGGGVLANAGTLAASPGELATQITATGASNGNRVYAEHNSINGTGIFTFEWTAPDAGTGTVSMYSVGNAVNGAAGNGGDFGSDATTLISLVEAGTLPVTLTGFRGESDGKTINLQWATQEETGFSHFGVERLNRGEWREIGRVPSLGSPGDYRFTDDLPLEGTNSYRLRSVDLDGTNQIGPIVNVVARGLAWSVYPNPTAELLYVRAETGDREPVRVMNQNGRIVLQGSTDFPLRVAALPAGTYYVIKGDQTRRFIKQ